MLWNIVPYRGTITRCRPYRIPARPGHASTGSADSAGRRILNPIRKDACSPAGESVKEEMEALLESSP
ncbi:hypothetical protein CBM2585_A80207 [Cupriavidus taiwanensis]|uniref:Uncharacterized protein n=1 Tax=Cupriavidus taiwanensis TaxID=164546 RepID=A0A7Z7NL10_9BURK|nr:hypothetical protein CBM2585_A80207 [Cupriavidus taiwanensis]SOZ02203.1 hypothetical protein CBM2595_A31008 [Cupriavidus taiwanensis]SPC09674.1 hypothetical protein CBM2594_A40997 [Cupriavidus taiwanensis]